MVNQIIGVGTGMKDDIPTVIYIGGYGRSGSTLLDILIGSHSDVEGVGELVNIYNKWEAAIAKNDENGNYWRTVKSLYDKQIGGIKGCSVTDTIFSMEWIGSILRHMFNCYKKKSFEKYSISQLALFSSIAKVSSKSAILDSSKTAWRNAWRPLALYRAGLDVKVIHLVRDGRGVIWSFLRGDNVKMERGESDVAMRFPVARAILGWAVANICVSLQRLFLPKGSVIKVRYEDLVKSPSVELSRIGVGFGMSFREVEECICSGQELRGGRQISGNRLRKLAAISIKPDEEWKAKLPMIYRAMYWLFAAPIHLTIYSKFFNK